MHVAATEGKNRFGALCAQAKREPVFVEKAGRVDTVLLSIEAYRELQAQAQRNSDADAAERFYAANKDWIDAQNQAFEQHGVWSEGLVDWLKSGAADAAR